MKLLSMILGGVLGLFFTAIAAMFLLGMAPESEPAPPEGSPAAHFGAAVGATGYMHFVKVCELVGGLLTAFPKTRTWGILILTPIVANIFAYHVYVLDCAQIEDPMLLAAGGLTALVLLLEMPKIFGLLGDGKGKGGKPKPKAA